ncbi:MAG: flippase [Methanobacteriaceae archaeon]|jgi:O-antigen/teichoic acid export membrane protein|nr:flippase [Methanobacteriaceae archaeon]OPY29222.1 MAG: putative flippase AglR [Methanobacterium sp. PtaU1.Bin242]
MNVAQRILKNTGILSIAQIISYVLVFFYTIYIARYLGAEGFGILSFAIAIVGIFTILTDLGISTLTVRDVARDRSLGPKYLGNGLVIKVILAVVSFGLIALAVNLLNYPSETITVVYFIALSTIFGSIASFIFSIFQAHEKMEFQGLGQILNAVLMFSGVFIAIAMSLDVVGFSFVYFITSLISLIYSLLIYIWKFSLPPVEVDRVFWGKLLKGAIPFGITGIFVTIYYWIDSVMLSVMAGNEVVGWYNASYKVIFLFLSFQSLFIVSIFPVLSSFYKTSRESLKYAYERSFKYMLIISIPIAIFGTLVADKIILLIYGPDFMPSIVALQILIWTVVFMFINNISGNFLGSIDQQVVVSKVAAVGAVVNIVLNLVLIPEFSYVGSSFATVFTELMILPILVYVVHKYRYTSVSPLVKDLPKILVSGLAMSLFIIYFSYLNLFILLLASSIIYLGVIFITRTLDEDDIVLIRNIIQK